MNFRRTIGTALLALTLVPAYVAAQEMELKATRSNQGRKGHKGQNPKMTEKTILIGARRRIRKRERRLPRVTIKYTEKDGQLRASEINPR